MCGRFTLTTRDVHDLARALRAEVDAEAARLHRPRWNVAPTDEHWIVVLEHGQRVLRRARFGLEAPDGRLVINARSETAAELRAFRGAFQEGRCLVPADGFFEWLRGATARGGKPAPQPFYFHPRSGHLIAFAGLWARSRDAHGDELHSFTIVTTRANDLVRSIHDRMPIVLAPEDWATWLDPAVDSDTARALLGHPAGDDWVREPVSTWVNKADHDDPRCIAPEAAEPESKQQRLFD